jgi:uncharacterized protein YqeY
MKINELIIAAIKAGDKHRASVLRVLAGELARLPSKEYTDEQVFSAARKMIKNAEMFPTEGTALEVQILQSILPAQLTKEQVQEIVRPAKQIKDVAALLPPGVDKAFAISVWKGLQ